MLAAMQSSACQAPAPQAVQSGPTTPVFIPSAPATASSLASEPPPAAGCTPRATPEQASQDLREANDLIRRAREHPTEHALSQILPRLERAAYAGDLAAQKRFGYYVVSYYYTDELFWPGQPEIAIAALAMLRVAARKSPGAEDALLAALARDPVAFTDPDGPPPLPREWLDAALREAKRWGRLRSLFPQPRPRAVRVRCLLPVSSLGQGRETAHPNSLRKSRGWFFLSN